MMAHLVETGGGSSPARAAGPFLVVVPASLVPNWKAELAAWAPGLRAVVYRGTADEREHIFATQVGSAAGLTGGWSACAGDAQGRGGGAGAHLNAECKRDCAER